MTSDQPPAGEVVDLSPCPFCGGKSWPEVTSAEDCYRETYWFVSCPYSGCRGGGFYERKKAIAAWNARTSLPKPSDAGVREETGWLIEENVSGFIHWIALAEDEWPRQNIKTIRKSDDFDVDQETYRSPVTRVKDASAAIRFARKDDAEAFIKLFDRFLLAPVATEHAWDAALSAPPLSGEDAVRGEVEGDDIIAQAMGRAKFLRDRGEIKTPEIIERLIDKIGLLNMEATLHPTPEAPIEGQDVEAVARELLKQMEEQGDDSVPSSIQRDRGLTWLEGWFDLAAALRAPIERKGEGKAIYEKCARVIDNHRPDASFDDSGAGALERNALLDNLAAEIRALGADAGAKA